MLCCGSKRARCDDNELYNIERFPTYSDVIQEQGRILERMNERIHQLENLVLAQNELLKNKQPLVDLVTDLDKKYAKQLKDIDITQRANNRNVADILKLVVVLTKYHETTFADLPVETKELCQKMEALVGQEWRRFGIALGIPESAIDQIKGSNKIEHFWNVIQFRCTTGPIKIQDLQTAFLKVKKVGVENLSVMPAAYREIIESYKSVLYMDVVDAVIVLPYMRCFVYIPPESAQYVMSPSTKIGRMANLIDILPTLGADALQVLTDALFHSGHEGLANQIKDSVKQKGYTIEEARPLPLDETDRKFLYRRSGLERSSRIIDDIKEIRKILMDKIREQLDEELTECSQL